MSIVLKVVWYNKRLNSNFSQWCIWSEKKTWNSERNFETEKKKKKSESVPVRPGDSVKEAVWPLVESDHFPCLTYVPDTNNLFHHLCVRWISKYWPTYSYNISIQNWLVTLSLYNTLLHSMRYTETVTMSFYVLCSMFSIFYEFLAGRNYLKHTSTCQMPLYWLAAHLKTVVAVAGLHRLHGKSPQAAFRYSLVCLWN